MTLHIQGPSLNYCDVLYGMLTSQWTISDIETHEEQVDFGSHVASTIIPVRQNLETWLQKNSLTEVSICTFSYHRQRCQ
jgi:hypothetical protein